MTMAMSYEPAPQPKERRFTLGQAVLVFENVTLEVIGYGPAENVARRLERHLNGELKKQETVGLLIGFESQVWKIGDLSFSFERLEDGSIRVSLKNVGMAFLTSYTIISGYPSFKEAIPMIQKDVAAVLEYVAENAPDFDPSMPAPLKYELYFRELEDVEYQFRTGVQN